MSPCSTSYSAVCNKSSTLLSVCTCIGVSLRLWYKQNRPSVITGCGRVCVCIHFSIFIGSKNQEPTILVWSNVSLGDQLVSPACLKRFLRVKTWFWLGLGLGMLLGLLRLREGVMDYFKSTVNHHKDKKKCVCSVLGLFCPVSVRQ